MTNKIALGDELPIGFNCPLCNKVYPRVYQMRWQMKHQRQVNLEYICRKCVVEMEDYTYQAKFFNDHVDELPFRTGEVREVLPSFLKDKVVF